MRVCFENRRHDFLRLLRDVAGEAFAPDAAGGPRQWLGDTLGVAAAIFWAATTLAIRATALAKAKDEELSTAAQKIKKDIAKAQAAA